MMPVVAIPFPSRTGCVVVKYRPPRVIVFDGMASRYGDTESPPLAERRASGIPLPRRPSKAGPLLLGRARLYSLERGYGFIRCDDVRWICALLRPCSVVFCVHVVFSAFIATFGCLLTNEHRHTSFPVATHSTQGSEVYVARMHVEKPKGLLRAGDRVSFRISKGDRGPHAVNVRKVAEDGSEINVPGACNTHCSPVAFWCRCAHAPSLQPPLRLFSSARLCYVVKISLPHRRRHHQQSTRVDAASRGQGHVASVAAKAVGGVPHQRRRRRR